MTPDPPPGLHLVTYNVHLGGARAATAHLLAAWQPALLCLQETRDPAALPLPPGTVAHWQPVPGGTWGSAVLVRGGTATPLPQPPDLAGWVAGGGLHGWPGGSRPVHAYSIHAPPGLLKSYTRTVGRILDLVAPQAAGADLVLAGDFNVVVGRRGPDEPIRMSRAEAALLDRLEHDLGLLPAWQTAHPGQPLARTLRWRHRADSLPYHCDGLFLPAAWRPALRACAILTGPPWDTASDHHPVVATLHGDPPPPPAPGTPSATTL
jgi:endonuclease/exonuclease/phosphatase family metal-dependent hydrolase